MDKSIEWQFDSYMQEIFQMQEVDVKTYSPLALAYIGDCVFDLIIKSLVLNQGNKQVQKLHKETSQIVQASSQSMMMRALQERLWHPTPIGLVVCNQKMRPLSCSRLRK